METLLIPIVAIWCLYLLAREFNAQYERHKNLEKRITDLEIKSLQRIPFRSQEELLDTMAAISRYMEERKIQDTFIENAAGHITNAMRVGTKREK